jgi:hypothetical protein
MEQKELAKLLDISPAMVSRLKKKGMPIDTKERAERWRKRHLEPGRIKGARFDPKHETKPTDPKSATTTVPGVSVSDAEAVGIELDNALTNGDQSWSDLMINKLRTTLRQMVLESDPYDEVEPRLSLRVWLALCSYVLVFDDAMLLTNNPVELLTPVQFCRRHLPHSQTYPLENHHTLSHACDWQDYSIKGWPEYPDEPD